MDRLRLILREPALLTDAAETVLVLLVALGLNFSGEQQGAIVAIIIAAAAFVKGWVTKPFPVTVLTDLTRAGVVLALVFGLNVDGDRVMVAATAVGTLITLMQREQITPTYSPAITGAPVTEVGAITLAFVGVLLLVLAALLLILDLTNAVKGIQAWLWIVVGVIGLVLVCVDAARGRTVIR